MLFKGKLKRLNNKKYSLIDWPAGSTTKKLFYQELIGQTEAKVNATRAKLIFSGKGFPPKVMDNGEMATLKTLLKTNNNSIGYALKADVSDEFTILYILETESSDEK